MQFCFVDLGQTVLFLKNPSSFS